MSDPKKFVVRCRGIILHEGKLLVVRHAHDPSFVSLPGGHVEWGEDVQMCVRRELIEELGVEPVMGRLLYVNTYQSRSRDSVQPFEFFFEITNGPDYVEYEKQYRSHAHEIADVIWLSPEEEINLLPPKINEDFKNGLLLSDTPRYINGLPQSL